MARRRGRKKLSPIIKRLTPGGFVKQGRTEVHQILHVSFGKGGWSYWTLCGLSKVFPRRSSKGLRVSKGPTNCLGCIGRLGA